MILLEPLYEPLSDCDRLTVKQIKCCAVSDLEAE